MKEILDYLPSDPPNNKRNYLKEEDEKVAKCIKEQEDFYNSEKGQEYLNSKKYKDYLKQWEDDLDLNIYNGGYG